MSEPPMKRALIVLLAAAAPLAAQTSAERVMNGTYARSHDYDLVHERIELSHFDWDSTSFDGNVSVTLVALRPAFDSVVLDAGHRLRIARVNDRGGALKWATHGDTLVVRLRRAVAMGDTVRFGIGYHGVVENGEGLTFLRQDSGASPHPAQIWSQGEESSNHAWFPTYDFPNDRLTWEMIVTVPKELTVVSNGRLVRDTPNRDGTHTVDWLLERPASSYLASIVVAPFVKLRDTWKGRAVDYYVYRGSDTAAARRLFRETPDQIAVYSRLTGVDYPWSKYAQSTVADFFGGMENVTASTLVDWIPDRLAYLDQPWYHHELIAHELAHQWFGDYVTTADWSHLWLNEGFATFMVGPYWRATSGEHAAQDYYLGDYHQFMSADRRRRMPVVALNSNNIYPKGALVLEMMRRYLGDERFWAGIHRYLVDHAYGNGSTDDLRQAMLAATGENLDWFFDEWLYQAGYPNFLVQARYDSAAHRLKLEVSQTQLDSAKADSTGLRFSTPSAFRMPVTIRIGTDARGGAISRRVWIDEREEEFEFDSLPGPPTMVVFDSANAVLKTLDFEQPTAWLAAQLAWDPDLWNRSWAIDQLAKRDSDAAAGAALATAAISADYKLTRAEAAEALGDFSPAIALPALMRALHDTSASVRAAALRGLRSLHGDSAIALAMHQFDVDSSYDVRAAALRVIAFAPADARRPYLTRALAMWSYREVVGDAALLIAAQSGDTTYLDAINAQVGHLSSATLALASFGRRGASRGYTLVSWYLTDPRPSVRREARQACEYVIPKATALALVEGAANRQGISGTVNAELAALVKRIEARPDKAP